MEPRRILGLRLVALAETAGYLAAALAVDHLLGSGDRLAGIAPHPFWAIVLLVSAQYGAREGLAAALLASVALLAGNLPEQAFGEDLYAWLLRATTEPLLWVFAAIGIGEIRDRHRRERDALQADLTETRSQAEAITDAYERLSALKDHLEARIAGQRRTLRTIFVATRAIERQETGQVLAGVRALVSEVMAPRKFSLFLRGDGGLDAATSEGWAEADSYACRFTTDQPLYQAVVSHRRFLLASRPGHALVLGEEGLMAGPITGEDGGEVIGMLKIEEMDFLDLSPAGIETFQVLCAWIGAAFTAAQQREEATEALHQDPLRGLMPAGLFDLARGLATTTARRTGHDLSLLLIGFDLPPDAAPSVQAAAARALARVAAARLSEAEPRFDLRRDGWDAAILLPGTGTAEAEAIAARLLPAVAEELDLTRLTIGLRHAVAVLHRRAPREVRSSAA